MTSELTSGRDIGGEFAAALRAADFGAIGRCLSPAVQLRALLPGGMVDAAGRAAAVAMLADWLEDGAGYTVLATSSDVVGQRLHLSYRVRLGGDEPRVIEQQAYCDVTADAISSVRLLCSGDMPLRAG
jgi:hypothetical protein